MKTIHGMNRRRSWRFPSLCDSVALIVALLLRSVTIAAAPTLVAVVRPDPLVSAVPVGGQVIVNIYIQDVQDLYGADIRLGFDPTVLQAQDVNPAVSGVQIQPLSDFLKPDFVVRNQACNVVDSTCPTAGVVRYAATQVNPSAPTSGSGALAAVTFKRLTPGVTSLEFVTHDLSDRNGVMIPSETQSGVIKLSLRWVGIYLPLVCRSN